MQDYAQRLQAKISPENVAVELVRAGCFLTAYELIKTQVVDAVHDFFWCGFEDGNNLYDEATYQRDVRSRDPKSKYRASCLWLIEMQALTVEQVETLERIHAHRQEIAHELPELLVDPDFSVDVRLLADAIECVRALGVFCRS